MLSVKIREVKQEYQLQQWSRMLRERKESGLSVKEWCLEQGISEHSYYYRLWEGDGFLLLYKRLLDGKYQWPRSKQEVMEMTQEQF